jgi:hypothetical protein
MKTFLIYIIIGMMVSTYTGNLDSKYDTKRKIYSTLSWPIFAMNYFNTVSNIQQVDIEKVKKELAERQNRLNK